MTTPTTTTEDRLAAVEAEAAALKELLRVARRRIENLELGHKMAATLAASALERWRPRRGGQMTTTTMTDEELRRAVAKELDRQQAALARIERALQRGGAGR